MAELASYSCAWSSSRSMVTLDTFSWRVAHSSLACWLLSLSSYSSHSNFPDSVAALFGLFSCPSGPWMGMSIGWAAQTAARITLIEKLCSILTASIPKNGSCRTSVNDTLEPFGPNSNFLAESTVFPTSFPSTFRRTSPKRTAAEVCTGPLCTISVTSSAPSCLERKTIPTPTRSILNFRGNGRHRPTKTRSFTPVRWYLFRFQWHAVGVIRSFALKHSRPKEQHPQTCGSPTSCR
mmetsp:Transcript_67450/g.140572  ORF Transcript_67450/g.140572 Transcript_67450/m.140572 type:complete len:236 (+) Transcript_67450:636-1343(+)